VELDIKHGEGKPFNGAELTKDWLTVPLALDNTTLSIDALLFLSHKIYVGRQSDNACRGNYGQQRANFSP
jgi:hypothetical protein